MHPIRVIHLSDSHLPAAANQILFGCSPYDSLSKVVDRIAELNPYPNALVVTGDLVDEGTPIEYALFKELVAPLQIPTYCLPGNHDSSAAMDNAADHQLLFVDKSVALGSWRLIMLNSQVQEESRGHLENGELKFLQQELTRYGNSPTLVALHHTPSSPCADAGCQLDNRDRLMSILRQHKQVKIVLAGHTHQADKTRLGHLDIFTAPSTFAQASHPENISPLDPNDFFASHALDGSSVGFGIFDLFDNGEYSHKPRWIEI